MIQKSLIEELFNAHALDLTSIFPEIKDIFVCPICLNEFTKSEINSTNLSDGHIWPDYIRGRSRSAKASSQHVLLCKSCNSKAGSRGDAHMQAREQVHDANVAGKLFGDRKITVLLPDKKAAPIQLHNIGVQVDKASKIVTLSFPRKRNKRNWLGNNPSEQARFTQAVQSDSKFDMIVHPQNSLRPVLWRVGWLTSAYLYTFYTFGYRLILHPEFDPVRRVISDSFIADKRKEFEFPESNYLRVIACGAHNSPEPRMTIAVPVKANEYAHIEVDFLNYHVKLPFVADEQIFWWIVFQMLPDFDTRLIELRQENNRPKIELHCTKTRHHDCMWDYVLGKPISE
jgi:hypothetical protein